MGSRQSFTVSQRPTLASRKKPALKQVFGKALFG